MLTKLESAIASSIVDVDLKLNANRYPFDSYLRYVRPYLNIYQHHLGSEVIEDDFRKRFVYETALAHVLIHFLFRQDCPIEDVRSSIFSNNQLLNWYSLPTDILQDIYEIYERPSIEQIGTLLSQISADIVGELESRYFGEFYTPFALAKHLIKLSGLTVSSIVSHQLVLDPACGGGIILATIADDLVKNAFERKISPEEALQSIISCLYGYDIQPFAVTLTRLLILYISLPLLRHLKYGFGDLRLDNIRLLDTLASTQTLQREGLGFDFIIGNPPFMSIKKEILSISSEYDEITYGHPNLYQLFLWSAYKISKRAGIVSFLIPQSVLSGNNFKKLREKFYGEIQVLSITRMMDRKGIIGDADQPMMAFCFKVLPHVTLNNSFITISTSRNGDDIDEAISSSIQYQQVIRKIKDLVIWVVSDSPIDYRISEEWERRCKPVSELGDIFQLGNGAYVWNQHRELLKMLPEQGSIPLISAASISPFGFNFPYIGSRGQSERQFSLYSDDIADKLRTGRPILIQRTTRSKVGRRLVASVIPREFVAKYPQFFIENHVNYINIISNTHKEILRWGLLGWLNSDLTNFIFQLRSGTAQVSLFELNLLSINLEMLEIISPLSKQIFYTANPDKRISLISKLNETLFDWLELSVSDRERIETVLSRKETSSKNV